MFTTTKQLGVVGFFGSCSGEFVDAMARVLQFDEAMFLDSTNESLNITDMLITICGIEQYLLLQTSEAATLLPHSLFYNWLTGGNIRVAAIRLVFLFLNKRFLARDTTVWSWLLLTRLREW